jgi:hypothetical protein
MTRFVILAVFVMFGGLCFADPVASPSYPVADPLAEQLETLQATAQAQIDALTMQMNNLEPEAKAEVEKQIVELKRQTEVQRLTWLRDAAQAAGSAEKVAEIQKALEYWLNPPATHLLPQVSGAKTQDSKASTSAAKKVTTTPKSAK